MRYELPKDLSPEILEIVVRRRLEDKHGVGTATPMVVENHDPFRATVEVIDRNGIWVHVYVIDQEGDRFFFEFRETREEAKKHPQAATINLGELLRTALSKNKK